MVIGPDCRGDVCEDPGDGVRLDCQPHHLALLHYLPVATGDPDALCLKVQNMSTLATLLSLNDNGERLVSTVSSQVLKCRVSSINYLVPQFSSV